MQSDDPRSDEITKAYSWDEMRQMFRNVGVPLSPEQEAQYQQAKEQLRAALEPEFRAAPIGFILKLLVMVIMPKWVLDMIGGSLLVDALRDYLTTMAQFLTPEQREVWERSRDR